MHDTAFRIGALVLNAYCTLADADILEIGAYDVNGTLRDHILPTTRYTGVDFEAGPGVDVVVEPGQPYPVPDEAFDIVMATSVLEHDGMFWMTFLEMCRKAKPGGCVYVSAPANGMIHRYPEDNWRFYPDSAKSLMRWAQSQGQDVILAESFTAERENDHWNDFCAIFRKGPITQPMSSQFVHLQVPCTNVFTWQSDEMIKARPETEDMLLLTSSKHHTHHLECALFDKDQELGSVRNQVADLEKENEKIKYALSFEKNQNTEILINIGSIKQELKQKNIDYEDEKNKVNKLKNNLECALLEIKENKLALEDHIKYLNESLKECNYLKEKILDKDNSFKELYDVKSGLIEELSSAHQQLDKLKKQLSDYEHDLANVQSTLRQREEEISQTLASLDEERCRAVQAEEEREAAHNALEFTQGQLKTSNEWVFRLAGERQSAQEQVKLIDARLAKTQKALSAATAQLVDAKEHQTLASTERRELLWQVQELSAERDRLTTLADSKRAEAEEVARHLAASQSEVLSLGKRLEEREQEIATLATAMRAGSDNIVKRQAAYQLEVASLSKMLEEREQDLATLANSAQARVEEVERHLAASQSEASSLKTMLQQRDAELVRIRSDNGRVQAQFAERLDREVTLLSGMLRVKEDYADRVSGQAEWLKKVNTVVTGYPQWWMFVPKSLRMRWQRKRLQRKGLFDADAYLARYPDVSESGMDPLRHYILHGIDEARSF